MLQSSQIFTRYRSTNSAHNWAQYIVNANWIGPAETTTAIDHRGTANFIQIRIVIFCSGRRPIQMQKADLQGPTFTAIVLHIFQFYILLSEISVSVSLHSFTKLS